jgi:hypothetical protein
MRRENSAGGFCLGPGLENGAGALKRRAGMYYSQRYGEVAERFKAAVLKTAEPVRVP